MRLSENRALAWIVLAVCVIGSVAGLGGGSLSRQRGEIVNVFYNGAEDRDSSHSMSAYLNRAYENARVMALEVELRLGKSEVVEAVNAIDADFLENGGGFKRLKQLADDMYNDVYAANLTDEQRVDFKAAYDDFQGAFRMAEKDPYLDLAAEFNAECSESFVSSLVCRLWGIDPLHETF